MQALLWPTAPCLFPAPYAGAACPARTQLPKRGRMLLDPCIYLLFYFTLQRHAHVVSRSTVVGSISISNYLDYNKPYLRLLSGTGVSARNPSAGCLHAQPDRRVRGEEHGLMRGHPRHSWRILRQANNPDQRASVEDPTAANWCNRPDLTSTFMPSGTPFVASGEGISAKCRPFETVPSACTS